MICRLKVTPEKFVSQSGVWIIRYSSCSDMSLSRVPSYTSHTQSDVYITRTIIMNINFAAISILRWRSMHQFWSDQQHWRYLSGPRDLQTPWPGTGTGSPALLVPPPGWRPAESRPLLCRRRSRESKLARNAGEHWTWRFLQKVHTQYAGLSKSEEKESVYLINATLL